MQIKSIVQIRMLLGLLLVTLGLSGCNPFLSSCERKDTATVSFKNTGSLGTQTVIWDGSSLTTLGNGETSGDYTVSSGTHTVRFDRSGSPVCASTNESVSNCQSYLFTCGG